MLINLSISNVALIEKADINFSQGLNIMSGETGSGKSMIIDSMNFILGSKVSKDFIRTGEEQAKVELTILVNNESNKKVLKDLGVEIEDDNLLVISRVYNQSGKSSIRLNGSVITIGMIKELAPYFVDFHGQHDNQSLLNSKKHIIVLDKFCVQQGIDSKKENLANLLKDYRKVRDELQEIERTTKENEDKRELYTFQLSELEQAKLIEGEEELLEQRKTVLLSMEKIRTNSTNALSLMANVANLDVSESQPMTELLHNTLIMLNEIKDLDDKLVPVAEKLEQIQILLKDVVSDMSAYVDSSENDEENDINKVEERLHTIFTLKKKYNLSVKEIIEYSIEVQKKLDSMDNYESDIKKINDNKNKLGKDIIKQCEEISEIRNNVAQSLAKSIEGSLEELGMKNSKFKIDVRRTKEFSSNGFDEVEFLISPNVGEEVKPLDKIASGGEMSRIMLALKSIIATADDVETFIFDEIDTGISGRTAQIVAEKLVVLSSLQQLVVITHLPQIAAMADNHIYIEKNTKDDKTTTTVAQLKSDDIINELARLLGGAKITESTIKASAEMKELADTKKNSIL